MLEIYRYRIDSGSIVIFNFDVRDARKAEFLNAVEAIRSMNGKMLSEKVFMFHELGPEEISRLRVAFDFLKDDESLLILENVTNEISAKFLTPQCKTNDLRIT